jgi:alkylated DNA repair dioxygenase AlkB
MRRPVPSSNAALSKPGAESLVWPDGWRYESAFLSDAEQQSLLAIFGALPFEHAQYKEWTARRRLISYGGRYDFARGVLEPASPVPQFLQPLRQRAALWAGLEPEAFQHASVAEYAPGTQLGWHRDVPEFDAVIGVSLLGWARMRFRPYRAGRGGRGSLSAELEPRSIYLLRGAVRWSWQHAISPTRTLRYSVTFRSRARRAAAS